VLVVTGEKHRELGVPGEKEFYGRGVTYCATCDAPLFKDKDVIVVGGGNSAMESALFLEKYATKVVILTINDALKGDGTLMKKIESSKKISVLPNVKTTKILGDAFVTGMEYETKDGEKKVMKTQGVFIEIGLIPVSDFIDMVKKNKWNEIEVDMNNRTSVPGIWAAGDVTTVTEKQIAVAVGEGSKAALRIIKYLQQQE
jgi:alkyl hydroperoxide reductase subunit AhpF